MQGKRFFVVLEDKIWFAGGWVRREWLVLRAHLVGYVRVKRFMWVEASFS